MMQDAPNGMNMQQPDPMMQYRSGPNDNMVPPRSEISFNLSEADHQQTQDTHRERLAAERELMNMGINADRF